MSVIRKTLLTKLLSRPSSVVSFGPLEEAFEAELMVADVVGAPDEDAIQAYDTHLLFG